MKPRTTRLLCSLLLLLLLFTAVACKSEPESPVNTGDTGNIQADPNDPYANYINEIGARNYENREFIIATRNTDTKSFFTLHPDEGGYQGNMVSDAMYARDLKLESDYGILVTYQLYSDGDDGKELASNISNAELGNLHTCDMIASNIPNSIGTLQAQNVLYNIEQLPVINSGMPWWSEYFWENVSFNNRLYFVAGQAAGGGFFATPYVMICSLALAQDVVMQDGSTLDIFGLVESGDWTLENFEYLIHDYTIDLDGDQEISVYHDRIAYATPRSEITAYSHFVAAGMQLSSLDEDGNITIDLGENTADMVQRLCDIFAEIENNFDHAAYFDETPSQSIVAFKQNRALFFGNSVSYVDEITDMTTDYAIIPCPKATAEQESYYSGINTWTPGYLAFPNHCGNGDTDFVGYVAEVMGYHSYQSVKPQVYDEILCLRLAKDPRQVEIMDTIYNNLYVDLNYINDFGTSASLIADCIMDSKVNFSSSKAAIETVLDLVLDKFEKDMSR